MFSANPTEHSEMKAWRHNKMEVLRALLIGDGASCE